MSTKPSPKNSVNQQTMMYTRPLWLRVLISIGISVVVGIVFLGYMFAIGIPKTTARNYYNEAEISLKQGDTTTAKNLLQQAYEVWPEGYIEEKLDSLQ